MYSRAVRTARPASRDALSAARDDGILGARRVFAGDAAWWAGIAPPRGVVEPGPADRGRPPQQRGCRAGCADWHGANSVRLPAREAYALWADSYPPWPHNPLMHAEQKVVAPIIASTSPTRALDVGTGSGRYLPVLAATGARLVVGVDFSLPMLTSTSGSRAADASLVDRHHEGADARAPGARVCGDACRLPFQRRVLRSGVCVVDGRRCRRLRRVDWRNGASARARRTLDLFGLSSHVGDRRLAEDVSNRRRPCGRSPLFFAHRRRARRRGSKSVGSTSV